MQSGLFFVAGLWFFRISGFVLQISLFSQNVLQRREVAYIVSKPLVSSLWGCGEPVNPPKWNIQEVQGGLCPLDQRVTQACYSFFRISFTFANRTAVVRRHWNALNSQLLVMFFCFLSHQPRGVCKNFGASVGRLTLCFSLFSTGMFISSTGESDIQFISCILYLYPVSFPCGLLHDFLIFW